MTTVAHLTPARGGRAQRIGYGIGADGVVLPTTVHAVEVPAPLAPLEPEAARALVRELPLSLLRVDHTYQRAPIKTWIRKLARDFQESDAGVLHVSERADGRYYLLDGQHRVEAMRRRGWTERTWPCVIHTGLSVSEEAHLFGRLNAQRSVHTRDRFRARLAEGEPIAKAIQATAAAFGLALSLTEGPRPGHIACVGRMDRIAQRWGLVALSRVLEVLTGAWGTQESDALHWRVVEGLDLFLRRYSSDPRFRQRELIERLRKVAPARLLRDASALQATVGGSNTAVAMLLLRAYNTKRLAKHRLPDWSEPKEAQP